MMIYISPKLVISVFVTLPLSIIYTRYMTKKTRPLFAKRSKKYGSLNGFPRKCFQDIKPYRLMAA